MNKPIKIKNALGIYSEIYAGWPNIIADNNNPNLEICALKNNMLIEPSDLTTIFLYTEPDTSDIFDNFYKELTCRPHHLVVINGKNYNTGLKNTMFSPFNMTTTALANQNVLPVCLGTKKYLANALFGGWAKNRAIMFDELRRYDLLDQCLINHRPRQQSFAREYQDYNYIDYQSPAIVELDLDIFSKLAYDDNRKIFTMASTDNKFASPWLSQIIPYNIHNSSYISLVSETFTGSNMFFVTEKLAKSLIVGQPFLVFGCQHFLEYLRDLGFQTFNNWLDESYDQIENADNRARAIIKSLYIFSQLSNQDKQQAIIEMQSVTAHNRRLVFDSKKLLYNLYNSILDFKKI